MTDIAYLYHVEFPERRRGIFERATELGLHVSAFQNDYLGATLGDALRVSHPAVCIVEPDYIARNRLSRRDFPVPVVVCDIESDLIRRGFTGIMHDRSSDARKAMDSLMELKLPHCAFVGYHRPEPWSQRRETIYRQYMRAAGIGECVFSRSRRMRLPDFLLALEKWLSALPKPCGVFAANDEIGDYVLTLSARLGIDVPGSLAVIGIDNDAVRCENTTPPLASVPPDFVRSGRMAVDLALELLKSPKSRRDPLTYGAGPAILRGSMRRFRQHDSSAIAALDFIRTHLTDRSLGIVSVATAMNLPVSTARVRFQRYTGHTIFDEIENLRFLLACSHLRDRQVKIGTIHKLCGYGSSRTLRNVFLKRLGLTPSDWRSTHA